VEADAVRVSPNVPSACGVPLSAEVRRVDSDLGLVLLRIARGVADPVPATLSHLADLPETSPLASLGWRVRTSPFVPREPVVRVWRTGQLSSKQYDPRGRVALVLADVGINPDFRGGPIVDDRGELAGFTRRDGDPTNLTRVVPAEAIARMLEGANAQPVR
jgi:hypothetical protein